MTWRAPEPLTAQHRLDSFDCGQPTLNHWLVHHAREAQASGSAKTFVVADHEDRVAGYFSLTVGQIDTIEAPERRRQGMGRFPLPVVILTRLALSTDHQGLGIGVGMLQDAAGFYTRFGFIPSPLRPQQLLLLLKDARKIHP